MAINSGGSIRLTQPDTRLVEPQSAGIHVGVHDGSNGTDLSVDIQCLQ